MVSPIRSSDFNKPVSHNIQRPRRASEDWQNKPDPRPLPPIQIKPSADVLPNPVKGKYDGTKPMPAVHIKFDPAYDGSFFKIPKPVQEQKKGEGLFVGPPVRIDQDKKVDHIFVGPPVKIDQEKKDDPILVGPPVSIDQIKIDDPILVGTPVKTNKKWSKCSAVDLYYPAQDLAQETKDSCSGSNSLSEKKELAAA